MSQQTALERSTMRIRGEHAELVVADGRITIEPHGDAPIAARPLSFGLAEVRGATVHAPVRGAPGWIHLAVVGGSPTPPSELAAVGDPHTVAISSRSLAPARRLARMIDKHVRARGLPSDTHDHAIVDTPTVTLAPPRAGDDPPVRRVPDQATTEGPPPPPPDARSNSVSNGRPQLVAELRELAELHTAGALTDEEFQLAKRRLLG